MVKESEPTVSDVLARLGEADLVGMLSDHSQATLLLDFTFGPGKRDVHVELRGVVHLVVARSPSDEVLCAFVGNVSLVPLLDGGKQLLERLGHPHRSPKGVPLSYGDLQHFRLEGEVFIEAVCQSARVFTSITAEPK